MIARCIRTKTTFIIALAGTALSASACAWPGSISYTTPIAPPTTAPSPAGEPAVDLPDSRPTVVTIDTSALQPGVIHKPGSKSASPQPTAVPTRVTASAAQPGASAAQPQATPQAAPQAAPRGTARVAVRPAAGAPRAGTAPAASKDEIPPLNLSQVTFATEGADFDPCVTPDGTRIVYASTQHRPTADIYVKPVDGRVVTQLTNDQADDLMPAVSPDGARIAFASNRSGNWDIYIMPIAGGRAVQVTSDAADEIHPSWSPDGKELVFCRMGEASGRWEMWVTDTANQSTSSFIGFGLFPQWCPVAGTGADGAGRILFQLSRERGQRAFGLWTVDYKDGTTSNATEVGASGRAAYINPTWSPDGQRIVYASVPNPSEWKEIGQSKPSSAELWMMSVDGTGRVNLTPGSTVALMPAWGLKNRLYFVASRGGADNIWSIDMGGAILAAGGTGPTVAHKTEHASPTGTTQANHEASAEPAKNDQH